MSIAIIDFDSKQKIRKRTKWRPAGGRPRQVPTVNDRPSTILQFNPTCGRSRTTSDTPAFSTCRTRPLADDRRPNACSADRLPIELHRPSDRGLSPRDHEDAVANPLSSSSSTPSECQSCNAVESKAVPDPLVVERSAGVCGHLATWRRIRRELSDLCAMSHSPVAMNCRRYA
jgi:hypothetical protein